MERGVPALAPFQTSNAYYKALPAKVFPSVDSDGSPDGAAGAPGVVCVAAAVGVSGATAASAAGDVVRLAASSRRWPAGAPVGGDPAPAFVQVSGDPAVASRTAFPVAAGISCRGSDPRCWFPMAACAPAVRWNGLHGLPVRRNFWTGEADHSVRLPWPAGHRAPKMIPAALWQQSAAVRDSTMPEVPDSHALHPCGASGRLPGRYAFRGKQPLRPTSDARWSLHGRR